MASRRVPRWSEVAPCSCVTRALAAQLREKFELVPQVVVLETGTLAREFEANVKAARFIDRR